MPKKEKVKWKKLCKEDVMTDFENLNFENFKFNEGNNFVKTNSGLKRISEKEPLVKRKGSNVSKKNLILKGFYENEQIQSIFTNLEKIKRKATVEENDLERGFMKNSSCMGTFNQKMNFTNLKILLRDMTIYRFFVIRPGVKIEKNQNLQNI